MPEPCQYLNVVENVTISTGTLIFIIAVVTLVFGVVIVYCVRRSLRRQYHEDMMREIGLAVNKYMEFRDENPDREHTRLKSQV